MLQVAAMAVKQTDRLGPVFVISEHLADVSSFYEEIVGLSAVHREEDHHVWFRIGGLDFAVHSPQRKVGPDYTPNERGVLMCFRSERPLNELVPLLEQRNLPHWGPFDGGARELLYTLDPDGNMVGLYVPT